MVKGFGSSGLIRMVWSFHDPRILYYEHQWIKRESCDSYGNVIRDMAWVPKDIALYLDYLIGGMR